MNSQFYDQHKKEIITGGFVILAAIIGGIFTLCQGPSVKQSIETGDKSPVDNVKQTSIDTGDNSQVFHTEGDIYVNVRVVRETGEYLIEEADKADAAKKPEIEVKRLHNKINEIYRSVTDKPSIDHGQWADQFFKTLPIREEQKKIENISFRDRSLDQIEKTQDLFVEILKFIDGRMQELQKRGYIININPINAPIYIEWSSGETEDIFIREYIFSDGRVQKLLLRRGKTENGIFREKSSFERYPELYLKGKEGESVKIRGNGGGPRMGGSGKFSVSYSALVAQDVPPNLSGKFFDNLAKAYDKLMEGFFIKEQANQ